MDKEERLIKLLDKFRAAMCEAHYDVDGSVLPLKNGTDNEKANKE